jgi:large subunit ribosomal protein L13
MTTTPNYIIDAQGKKLGRVAAEAASVLLGKKSAHFVKNKIISPKVEISNAAKLDITEKKMDAKVYLRYSGYPGGLTREGAKLLASRKGYKALLEHAIYGMLPKNKLRKGRMRLLTITD